jgi:hypothetical protein
VHLEEISLERVPVKLAAVLFVDGFVVGWKEKNGEGDGFGLRGRCRREGRREEGQGVVKMVSGNSSLPWLAADRWVAAG